jgi:hypothetical protein
VQKRFPTPDPVVSNPWSSQAYPRYAYVWNNPLRYTDPSGFDPEPAGDGGAGLDVHPGDLVVRQVTIVTKPPAPDTAAGWRSMAFVPRRGRAEDWVSRSAPKIATLRRLR